MHNLENKQIVYFNLPAPSDNRLPPWLPTSITTLPLNQIPLNGSHVLDYLIIVTRREIDNLDHRYQKHPLMIHTIIPQFPAVCFCDSDSNSWFCVAFPFGCGTFELALPPACRGLRNFCFTAAFWPFADSRRGCRDPSSGSWIFVTEIDRIDRPKWAT